ncbi:MAG: methylated-DNA--[protein]-cysteine S-methyltransferase [Candidatus Obscuribacterales bacterium]|nr:methylated-DNA--[protein]-cysteine S-methyltransferase [Candidatus Obscuribacterales bacterium]
MKYYTYVDSPIGKLLLRSDGDSLISLYMELEDIDYTPAMFRPLHAEQGRLGINLEAAVPPTARASSNAKMLSKVLVNERMDESLPVFKKTISQLSEYFFEGRKNFELPLEMEGTAFQKSVWTELLSIPYGTVRSYGEMARLLGNPAASRAVGLANGRNPISIVVPCHRVIGSNGSLTGYGGGVNRKKFLLNLEYKVCRNSMFELSSLGEH